MQFMQEAGRFQKTASISSFRERKACLNWRLPWWENRTEKKTIAKLHTRLSLQISNFSSHHQGYIWDGIHSWTLFKDGNKVSTWHDKGLLMQSWHDVELLGSYLRTWTMFTPNRHSSLRVWEDVRKKKHSRTWARWPGDGISEWPGITSRNPSEFCIIIIQWVMECPWKILQTIKWMQICKWWSLQFCNPAAQWPFWGGLNELDPNNKEPGAVSIHFRP